MYKNVTDIPGIGDVAAGHIYHEFGTIDVREIATLASKTSLYDLYKNRIKKIKGISKSKGFVLHDAIIDHLMVVD